MGAAKEANSNNVERVLVELNHPHIDEHEEHPDERWLVSYADMMTLLFGLFVLLFSMSTLDKKQQQAIRESTEEQFGTKKEPEVDVEALKKDLQQSKDEANQLNLKLTAALQQLDAAQKSQATAQQDASNNKVLRDMLQKLQDEKQTIEQQSAKTQTEMQNLKAEKQQSEQQSQMLQQEVENLRNQLAASTQQAESKPTKTESLADVKAAARKQALDLQKQLKELTQDLKETQQANHELEQKLKKLDSGNGASEKQSFVALFINWPTKDHDVDLVIQDPQGKTFDFKHRKHSDHPGMLALDTRRGPGAELWQSDRLLPGRYKVSYIFYNQYGNAEPTTVTGTVFTPKGSKEFPPVKMNMQDKRKFDTWFDVDGEGVVHMAP